MRFSTSTAKVFYGGTHRVVAPGETVSRIRSLAGPLAITRVANVTGLDCIGIPVVMVCRPNARSLAVSQGKGTDLDTARASGLMEAAELYHAERVSLPLKLGSWNDLRFSHRLARVEALPRISISPFHLDYSVLWVEGLELLTSRHVWVPYEMVHMNYTLPFPSGSGCFVMSSNGLASGNHALEALTHGLCEVIERDATTLFRCQSASDQERYRVDLSTVLDLECRRILNLYERAGVSVGVWDITSDVGIAAFQCVILDADRNAFRRIGPIEGMGCHPVREVALLRALTEAAQARLTLIAGSRDDNGRPQYAEAQDEELIRVARERLALCPSRSFDATPTCNNATLEEDASLILGELGRAGFDQVIAVDLTKPEFNIPVVRVVVPGLETYHRVQGYVPGKRARGKLEAEQKEAGP